MPITPDDWKQIKSILGAALCQDTGCRSSFLDEHCPDEDLRAEVERLLGEHDQAGSFLSDPLIGNIFDSEPTPQTLTAAELLAGRYRVVRFIAKGGMGEVYEAEDLELHEKVAIKTVLPEIASNPLVIKQFKHEIQLARKVTHSNVCRIFDLVHAPRDSGSITFLTMELLDGITLATYLEQVGSVPLNEAMAIAKQMAQGLDAAHSAGVIHQDFKSGNVILINNNAEDLDHRRAVITDFGLAYNAQAAGVSAGMLGGTPAYMAPEQIEGRPLSAATDIYAFGVVLYELLTGHLPYQARTSHELLTKKLSHVPTLPSKYCPELSIRVERAILRCLAKAPEERFKSASQVVAHMEPPRRRWQRLTAASLLLVALGSAGGYEWRRAHLITADPTVAVVGFRNDSNDPDDEWLGIELSEGLSADVGGSKGIRAVPSDEVARVKTELSVRQNQSLEHEDLSSVREALGANYLLLGSYAIEKGAQKLKLNVEIHVQDSHGKTIAEVHENGNVDDYDKLMADAASQIRDKLGASRLSDTQAEELQNIYPSDPEASRLYSQALDKLRSFDPPAALALLKKATDRDPDNVAIHAALADTWTQLKHDGKAALEAKMAADLAQKASLPQEYIVLTQARAGAMNKQWDSAIEDYKSLFRLFPQNLNYGLYLAGAQLDGSHATDALTTLDSLTKLPPPSGTDPRIEMTRATAYGVLNNFNAELQSAQLALQEARKRNGRMMQAHAQLELCWAYRNLGHVDEAYAACNDAQTLFAAFGDEVSAAVALNDIATWLTDRGRYSEAKQLYDRVIQVNQKAGAQKDLAGACLNVARVLDLMGKPDDAEDYIKRALEAALPIGDKYDEALARILRGKILAGQGHPFEAEQEVQHALTLAHEIKNESTEAVALSNLAEYQSETDSARALATYRVVLRLRRQKGDQPAMAICLMNMGNVLFRAGNVGAAQENYREALAIDTQLKDKEAIAMDLISLAEVDLERGKLRDAQEKTLQATKAFRENQDANAEAEATSVLVRVLVAQKNAQDAAPHVQRLHEIASKDPETDFEGDLSVAEYLAATGKRDEAIQLLASLPSEAKNAGMNFLSLNARLELVRLQIGRHSRAELRKELSSIEAEARHAGFNLLVHQAKNLRL
jgi:serine/threonine protein kinase/tetratricopeptide (TPR) repeat protein